MNIRKSWLVVTFLGVQLMLTSAISAQPSGNAVSGAITVSGEGTASVPAEEALVVISLGTDGNAYYDPVTGMPIEGVEDIVLNATPVIDAMVAYGVPVNDIEVAETPFTGEWGSSTMPLPIMVVATIPQPTVEELSGLLDVVRQAAKPEGLFVKPVRHDVLCRGLSSAASGSARIGRG